MFSIILTVLFKDVFLFYEEHSGLCNELKEVNRPEREQKKLKKNFLKKIQTGSYYIMTIKKYNERISDFSSRRRGGFMRNLEIQP